ncbi:MAG TPA: hypothetical protein VF495_27105 [Phenylobacterium sp.]
MSLALTLLAAAAVATPPTAAEVQTLEMARVLDPLISSSREGRGYVEFAPTVETRDVACERTADGPTFKCVYEARVRRFFAQDFGPWQLREEIIRHRKGGGWVLTPQLGPSAAIRRGCAAIKAKYSNSLKSCSDLTAVLSGIHWIVSYNDPKAALGGGVGASVSRQTGRVEGVWVHE